MKLGSYDEDNMQVLSNFSLVLYHASGLWWGLQTIMMGSSVKSQHEARSVMQSWVFQRAFWMLVITFQPWQINLQCRSWKDISVLQPWLTLFSHWSLTSSSSAGCIGQKLHSKKYENEIIWTSVCQFVSRYECHNCRLSYNLRWYVWPNMLYNLQNWISI